MHDEHSNTSASLPLRVYEPNRNVQVISIDPESPYSCYHLALSHSEAGDIDQSLISLERLFSQANAKGQHSEQVFRKARKLYRELNVRLAKSGLDVMIDYLDQWKKRLEEKTGYGVGGHDIPHLKAD
jgi:hypothetical protein